MTIDQNVFYKKFIFRDFYIPMRMMLDLKHYIIDHEKVNDFLMYIFENDLKGACFFADKENLKNIPAFIAFLYDIAPIECWGSKEKVETWLNKNEQPA